MKKTPKKLTLHRETLHNLDLEDAENVVGGTVYTTRPSCARSCGCSTTCVSYCAYC
jgi:hypothetical protein